VVRNSYINGDWGNEETDGGMPFQNGKEFDIEFAALTNTTIKVSTSCSIAI
jgi:hypothetical protein